MHGRKHNYAGQAFAKESIIHTYKNILYLIPTKNTGMFPQDVNISSNTKHDSKLLGIKFTNTCTQ
jgi:hypothetical protein